MQDMTLELFSNKQSYGNSFTKTRQVTNNSVLGAADPIDIQDESDSDEGESDSPVLFQEILGQHIAGITAQDVANLQESNKASLKLDITGKSSEKTQKGIPSSVPGQLPDTLQEVGSGAFNAGINPSFGMNTAKDASMINEYQFFQPVSGNVNSAETPNLPVYQGKNRMGVPAGLDILQGMQLLHGDNQETFSSSLDNLSPLQNESSKGTITQEVFSSSLDTLSLSQQESGLKGFVPKGIAGRQTVDRPTHPSNILGDNVSIIDTQGNSADEKELSEVVQLSPETILSKNTTHVPASAAKDVANDSGKNAENFISKINGNIISGQEVLQESQMGEEGNSFENPSQNKDIFESTLFDALMQKISSGAHFSLDVQTKNDPQQSVVTDLQYNTQASLGIGTTVKPSSVEGRKDSVDHLLHDPSIPAAEQLHGAIMEQISQKMHLAIHGDRSEIKIHLTPPELGSIMIHFTEENDEIEAKIFVENAEVKAALEHNTRHLKETVASHGVEIHKLEVFVQNDTAREQKSPEYFSANDNSRDSTSRRERQDGNFLGEEKTASNNDLQTLISNNRSDMMIDYIL